HVRSIRARIQTRRDPGAAAALAGVQLPRRARVLRPAARVLGRICRPRAEARELVWRKARARARDPQGCPGCDGSVAHRDREAARWVARDHLLPPAWLAAEVLVPLPAGT